MDGPDPCTYLSYRPSINNIKEKETFYFFEKGMVMMVPVQIYNHGIANELGLTRLSIHCAAGKNYRAYPTQAAKLPPSRRLMFSAGRRRTMCCVRILQSGIRLSVDRPPTLFAPVA